MNQIRWHNCDLSEMAAAAYTHIGLLTEVDIFIVAINYKVSHLIFEGNGFQCLLLEAPHCILIGTLYEIIFWEIVYWGDCDSEGLLNDKIVQVLIFSTL